MYDQIQTPQTTPLFVKPPLQPNVQAVEQIDRIIHHANVIKGCL
jgi:hypothetical protein